MDNHYHLLIEIPLANLNQLMQNINIKRARENAGWSIEEIASKLKTSIENYKRIESGIAKYNREYVHSALGYLSPLEFEQKFYQNYCQEAA